VTSAADSSGRITIEFSRGSADNPEIAALEIYGTDSSGPPAIPPTPTGLTATAGAAQVFLSWNASPGATSYSLYRSITSNVRGPLRSPSGITATSFTDMVSRTERLTSTKSPRSTAPGPPRSQRKSRLFRPAAQAPASPTSSSRV